MVSERSFCCYVIVCYITSALKAYVVSEGRLEATYTTDIDPLRKINIALENLTALMREPLSIPSTGTPELNVAEAKLILANAATLQDPNLTLEALHEVFNSTPAQASRITNPIRIEKLPSDPLIFTYIIKGLDDECYLQMYGDICVALNFEPGVKYKNHATCEPLQIPALPENTLFFIYTNIIEQQYVGDGHVNLLSVVRSPYKKAHHNEFINPTYVPVNCDTVEWIQITIKDDTDSLVKFTSGFEKTLLKLHFRPRQYGFQ